MNISHTGVLFRALQLVPPEAAIEMLLTLPVMLAAGNAPTVICRGRVVRKEPPTPAEPWPGIAATITGYRLARPRESDPRRIRQ